MQRYGLPHDVTVCRPDRFLLQNHYRGDDGTDWFLLANASFSEVQETDLVFAPSIGRGRQALLYNPDDGRRYTLAMDGDTLHLRLGPSETVLIAFQMHPVKAPAWQPAPLPPSARVIPDPPVVTGSLSSVIPDPIESVIPDPIGDLPTLRSSWQVTLVNPQVDTVIRFETTPDDGGFLPDLKDTHPSFMGTATYRTTITLATFGETEVQNKPICPSDTALAATEVQNRPICPSEGQPRWLHLGKVCDIAEVFVNGQPAGLRWWGDPVFDIDGLLRPGDNELEIKVTTQMCNYMRTLTDNSAARRFTIRRNHEPVSAGLLGPVSLY